MNRAASHVATKSVLAGVIQNGRFHRKKAGVRELLTKERIILGARTFFFAGREVEGFSSCRLPLFVGHGERSCDRSLVLN